MKKINYLLLVLGIMLAVSACNKWGNNFTLKGKINGIQDGEKILLFDRNYTTKKIDTIATGIVKDGKFELKGKLKRVDVYYIGIEGMEQAKQVVLEKKDMEMYEDSLNPGIYNIKGSAGQEDFNKMQMIIFNIEMAQQSLYPAMEQAQMMGDEKRIDSLSQLYQMGFNAIEDEIKANAKKNPKSIISPILILNYSYMLDPKVYHPIYDAFTEEVKNTQAGIMLKDKIDILERTAVGKKISDIVGIDPNGNKISLMSVKGKVTLIDFWASWCGPCRKENPRVRQIYSQFHDKGFNILGVSLDDKAADWKEAIATDSLTWNHVSDLKGWESKAAKDFAIQAIPQTILIDANGTIIARNLNNEELTAKLSSLLGK
ncbi:MAG: TlpA disulfide reductase family protein [Bacteroidota bacterium]